MMEAGSQKQRRMLLPSSIQRKSFSNPNHQPRTHSISFSQSKKRISSAVSVDPYMFDSTTGSTLNRNPDDWVNDKNHRTCRRPTKGIPKPPSMENTNMDPQFGLKFKDNRKAVIVGSTAVNPSKNYKEKEDVKPINFGDLKKAKEGSCQLILRTRSKVEGTEDGLQTKSSAYHLPTNKKRRWPSKGSFKEFIDQQNAYFKEIDEYELDVEEVE